MLAAHPPTGPSPWIESSVHARELPSLNRQPSRQAESFAHVILRSRASKMRQWKVHQPHQTGSLSVGSLSSVNSSGVGTSEKNSGEKGPMLQPRSVPQLRSSASFTSARQVARLGAGAGTGSGAGIGKETGGVPSIPSATSGVNTPAALQEHIAWVDWMDEYERFKRSRMLVQQRKRAPSSAGPEAFGHDSPPSKPTAAQLVGSAPRRPSAAAMPPPGEAPAAGLKDQQGFLVPSLPMPDTQRRAASMPGALPSAPSPSVSTLSPEPTLAPAPVLAPDLGTKPRNIKGQVEAWWSAVKSGFNGPRPSPAKAALQPLESVTSPSGPPVVSPGLSTSHDRVPAPLARVSGSPVLLGEALPGGVLDSSTRGSPQIQSNAPAPDRLSYSTDVAPSDVDSDADNKNSPQDSKPASLQRASSTRNSPLTQPRAPTVLSDPFATPHRSVATRVAGASPASKQSPSDTPGGRSGSDMAKSPSTPPVMRKLGLNPRPSPTLSGSTPASPGSVGAASQRVPSGSLTDPTGQEGEDFTITVMWQTIRHRLQASKKACDAGLRRVVAEVNEFVEEQLHPPPEADDEDEGDAEDRISDFSSPDEDKVMHVPRDSALFAPPGMEAEYQRRAHDEEEQEHEAGSDPQADPDETAHGKFHLLI